MKSVEFTTTGSSNALGSFNTGDIAHNIPDDLADHFVNEACCAKYYTGPAKAAAPVAAAQAPVLAKRPRKPKAPADALPTAEAAAPEGAAPEGAAESTEPAAAEPASAE